MAFRSFQLSVRHRLGCHGCCDPFVAKYLGFDGWFRPSICYDYLAQSALRR